MDHGNRSCLPVWLQLVGAFMPFSQVGLSVCVGVCVFKSMRRCLCAAAVPAADQDSWVIVSSDGLNPNLERGSGGGLSNDEVSKLCYAARAGWRAPKVCCCVWFLSSAFAVRTHIPLSSAPGPAEQSSLAGVSRE